MVGCLTKVTPPMANTAHLAKVNSSLSSWGVSSPRPCQATDLERSSVEISVTMTIPTLIIASLIDFTQIVIQVFMIPTQTLVAKGVKKMW